MTRPTIEQIQEYCASRGNSIDAEKFNDYYEAVGWKVGRKPMKDWKAAVRLWERNQCKNRLTEFFGGPGYTCSVTESPIIAYARERARKAKQ